MLFCFQCGLWSSKIKECSEMVTLSSLVFAKGWNTKMVSVYPLPIQRKIQSFHVQITATTGGNVDKVAQIFFLLCVYTSISNQEASSHFNPDGQTFLRQSFPLQPRAGTQTIWTWSGPSAATFVNAIVRTQFMVNGGTPRPPGQSDQE